MSGGWVAGNVRGRLLLQRRLGREGARRLVTSGGLDSALSLLDASMYRPDAREARDLEAAQRAVAASTLLWIRVLSGWLPRQALETMRALAAWFELRDIEARLAYLRGGPLTRPFTTGMLATAWRQVGAAQSPAELREALASSPWGDPGGEEPRDLHLALRLSWARRVLASVPEAAPWAAGAVALVVARELSTGLDRLEPDAVPGLGARWRETGGIPGLRSSLPADAAWALEGVETPADLWRAETAWWAAVEADANALVRGSLRGRGVAVGVVALLALDATRVAAALAAAALHDSAGAQEALDAVL